MTRSRIVLALALAACGDGASNPGGEPGPGQSGTPASGPGSGSQPGTTAGGAASAAAPGSSSDAPGNRPTVLYGARYDGGEFHLGPVDWAETQWHNACAPGGSKYPAGISQIEGNLLAGVWGGLPDVGGFCDACLQVTTAHGKSAVLRIVTYGATTTNSIDVSNEAFALLNSGESPRSMSWQLASCPDSGPVVYEFQAKASEYWTSFWVRNARLPLKSVEVKSQKHPDFVPVARGADGSLTDGGGFGSGSFSIRLTGIDGQVIVHDFAWPAAGIQGQSLTAPGNFP